MISLGLRWGDVVRSMNDYYLRRVMHAVFNCMDCRMYFHRLMMYLSMIGRNSKCIHVVINCVT